MRITLDTNVLVSAFISKNGVCADVLDLVSTFEEIELVLSQEILSEFAEVMRREEVKTRFKYDDRDIASFEEAVRDVSEIIKVVSRFKVVAEDPDDDRVVNTAIDGKVQYIVSGDKHLQRLKKVKKVRIVTPRVFLGIVAKSFGSLMVSKADLGK